MDNEQGSQEYFREQARRIYGFATADPGGWFTREETARFRFADWLNEHHEENRPEMPACGVYYDLLSGALSEVNWNEIARHYIEAIEEEANA
jgi:hypothetical protein